MSGIRLIKTSLAGLFWVLLLVSAAPAKQLTPPLYWEPGHVPYEGKLLAAPYLTEGLKHWTEGNNVQKLLTRIGQHNDWPNLATIWPRGSGNAHEKIIGIKVMAVGEFNHLEGLDTCEARNHGDGSGRTPMTDDYHDSGAFYQAMGDSRRLFVSTRPGDLAKWPPEFSGDVDGDGIPGDDLDGDGYGDLPLIYSDEDVVVIYQTQRPNYGLISPGWTLNPCAQHEERIMSFSPAMAQDIMFHAFKVRNMSRWSFFPDVGPYDWYGTCLTLQWEQQQASGSLRLGWVDGLNMAFSYNPSFTDPTISGPTPIQAKIILRAPDMTDPATGDHLYDEEGNPVEVPLCLVSHATPEGGWGYWQYVSTGHKYRSSMALPLEKRDLWRSRQDPGVDWDNPGTMTPRLATTRAHDCVIAYGDPDFVVTVDDTNYIAYARAYAPPATSAPWNSTTVEAIDNEIGPLKDLARTAHFLYGNWQLPRPPKPPHARLIPGDRQVTITWDNLSYYDRDAFYDGLVEQGIQSDYKPYDFEGYRVYRSTTGKAGDAVLIVQFDLKNHVTLETGIRYKKTDAKVLTEDGQEVTGLSLTELDTIGCSQYDPDRGKTYGLGKDTGLRFSFVDKWIEAVSPGQEGIRRLTNGFRYFYSVTAFDFNYTDSTNVFSYTSLESPLKFGADNMVIPRENSSSYQPATITDNLLDLQLLDEQGNPLDKLPRDINVAGDLLLDEAEVTNNLGNLYVTIVNPSLIEEDTELFISMDSITNEPEEFFAETDYKAFQRIHVSLKTDQGNVLISQSQGLMLDEIGVENELEKIDPAHFFLYPPPDSAGGKGIPFSIEFDLMPVSSAFILANPVEVLSGTPLSEELEVEVKQGYSDGNNNMLNAFRAADFELEWIDEGDSLTLSVNDVTHGVNLPYRPLPGSSWAFVGSWSKFNRLSTKPRGQLQDSDFKDITPRMPKTPKKAGTPVKSTLYLSGIQIKISATESALPKNGDIWLVRSNYGELPEDSLGVLIPKTRPPVAGLRYRIVIKKDSDQPEDVMIEEVKVVPNPYLVANAWDQSPQQKRIAFINLPSHTVIRIYTISGNLVQVLRHDGQANSYTHNWKGGTEYWDLKNRFNMLIASGMYIFHVTDTRTGKTRMGKFAVIQ